MGLDDQPKTMEFGGLKSSTNRKKTTKPSDLEVLEGGMVWMGPPEPKKRGAFFLVQVDETDET